MACDRVFLPSLASPSLLLPSLTFVPPQLRGQTSPPDARQFGALSTASETDAGRGISGWREQDHGAEASWRVFETVIGHQVTGPWEDGNNLA